MTLGILFQGNDRPDIVFGNGSTYGGLHCGCCFEIYWNKWLSARIEFEQDWILIIKGKKYPLMYGCICKIDC